jgi:hypothetical protein
MRERFQRVIIYAPRRFEYLPGGFLLVLEKAKPFVRRGRKAAGLIKWKMAGLPKEELDVSSAFLFESILVSAFFLLVKFKKSKEGTGYDSGLLLQGLWGCLWRKRTSIR